MHHSGIAAGHRVSLLCGLGRKRCPVNLVTLVHFRAAKSAIAQIIANEGSNNRGLSAGSAVNHGMAGGGAGFFQMMVPGHKVGLIIGKGGETIKNLQESTGARVVIVQVTIDPAVSTEGPRLHGRSPARS